MYGGMKLNQILISILKEYNKTNYHINHNHTIKVVRGLLYHRCNRMVGFAREKCFILKNTIKYLEEEGHIYG
jgi:hypothetical protein